MKDITKAHATAELALLLPRGATVHVIIRGVTMRSNSIVEFLVPPTQHIGHYVGAILNRPYLYGQKGVLLRRGQAADALLEDLSVALFGEPKQLKAVWL